MKIYIAMYKFLTGITPPAVRNLLLLFALSVTIYRLFFLPSDVNLFLMKDITIARIIFRLVFMLFVFGAYWVLLGFLSVSVKSLFLMIPDIRKKAIGFTFINLLLLYIWSVAVIGFSDAAVIKFFTMMNLWFISSIISFGSGLDFVYRSGKYKVLKIFFFIFGIAVPIFLAANPVNHLTLYFFIFGGYILIVLYQIANFTSHYIDFKVAREKRNLEERLESWQDIFDRFYDWKFRNFINGLKNKTEECRSNRLIGFIMLGNIFITPLLFIGFLAGGAYVHYFKGDNPLQLFAGIFVFFTLISSQATHVIFMQRSKIEFLYTVINISRSGFERMFLISIYKDYFSRFLIMLVPIIITVVINNIFLDAVSFIPLIVYLTAIILTQLILIYAYWYKIISHRDYNLIKQLNTVKKFS